MPNERQASHAQSGKARTHGAVVGTIDCRILELKGWDRRLSVVEILGKRKVDVAMAAEQSNKRRSIARVSLRKVVKL